VPTAPDEALFYKAAGPAAAIGIGAVLTPLRELTPASNFTFVFVALTVVVAEMGGRGAGLLTALVSALSLDFFLTRPYLSLAMESKHDVVAFLGLAACGLIASALASRRLDRIAALESARAPHDITAAALARWDPSQPMAPQVEAILHRCLEAFPLSAAAARDEQGRPIASAGVPAPRPAPIDVLEGERLLTGGATGSWGPSLALPESGGRIPLLAGTTRVGWLDIWGDGRPASREARRGLAAVARTLALLITSAGRATPGP
jgi:hypothetical protein